MRVPPSTRWRRLALLPLIAALISPVAGVTAASQAAAPIAPVAAAPGGELPDPMGRGGYTPAVIQESKLGLASLQEPNSAGNAPTAGSAQAPEQLEIRGQLYYPADRAEPSPVLVLVHGNHGSCDAGQNSTTATCSAYKRNEAGYAYLAENLATWGYTTFSVSQDQMMMRQDTAKGKGMHQRRLLIAATLDALSAANAAGGLPVDEHTTIGTTLVGKLDLTRIGLMGHSRGGDGVTSFIDYNRIRTDGPRYPLRGVISLAPVDYERKAPYGVPYMTILPFCDGDVSNLQGARFYERSQYINGDDPFPRIQSSQLGAIHNWYNSVWYADGDADGTNNNDAACGNSAPFSATNVHPNNIRLSGAADPAVPAKNYVKDNSATYDPLVNTKISGDPARMGDQEKIGLATMSAFFRRYVGGEGAFDPYLTGELSDTDSHLQLPATACPTSTSGTRIPCKEYVSTSYFPGADERVDVIRPEVANPLGLNALGGTLSGSGFAYPYLDNGAVALPKKTAGGYDWCNPEPDHFAPAQLGLGTQPTGAKACPLPGKAELGGQNAIRENAPVNHSYGRQLALAWEPGQDARLTADIPAASQDVSGLKALTMGADVNFFDLRNPGADNRGDNTRTGTSPDFAWPNEKPTSYDTTSTTQDFVIALTDTAGHEATVKAGDERWGNALHMSTGTNTANTHIVLDQIRVPLSEFAAQGVDLTKVDEVELRFGEEGTPQSGSIQLADLRFQEAAVDEPLVLSDGTAVDQGAGHGAPATGPDPAAFLTAYDNTPGNVKLNDTVGDPFSATSWVVDDDKAQCPTASFGSIQEAVDFAAPWDTVVVCEGRYEESSTPVFGPGNPVATGAMNGLTITKPLKIKGAGADKVTILPDQSLDSLAGVTPYLRDGGGNVITVSRQSLGSTDTNELFVDISGVTVTAGSTYAEAGIGYFNAAGRVSESVVGPMRVATSADELEESPHGWGIVKTGTILGSGPGTVETELTVTDSVVTGYQSGGILFDGARGKDGGADNVVRTGIEQHGYVADTVVKGKANGLFPQTGIEYTSGSDGFVRNSRVTGNYFRPAPAQSFGILLRDAGSVTATGDIITGNGFAAYNANADGTAVREGAPFALQASFVGQGNPVPGGPADPSAGTEAVSGPDTTSAATVTTPGRLSTPPGSVPTTAGEVTDEEAVASLVDPLGGSQVKVGETVFPLVRAADDFAVRSAALLVDGEQVAVADTAPYSFTWTPGTADAGKEITFTTVVTDSSGQETTSEGLTIEVATKEVPPVRPTLALGAVTKDKKKGTATVRVSVNTAGAVALSGPKVIGVLRRTAGAGTFAVPVRLKPAARKVLNTRGRYRTTVTVVFRAASGGAVTRKKVVLLIKK
ncbi:Ig-like domain-containing protein [Nocardioides sp. 503]|uniref:Ig-like domain-containing protein n=1 Tax=Nocardioides sp. 503 TaxID=2508326 RepID=UPI001ADAB901|nr:Ig-like domain-containing protein [Nocardioides sp. 503]